MPRVVIDTNVIVSALYLPESKPATILAVAREGKITNLISQYILEEIQRILVTKFFWEDMRAKSVVQLIQAFSEIIYPTRKLSVIVHDADNRILECAVEGQADFIVSGDRHLTNLKSYQGIKIVNPAIFLNI